MYKALELLQGSKDEAIIIGDSKSDLAAAANAGIDSILFYPKHNEIFYDRKFLESFNPTYTISDYSQIVEIVG